MVHGSNYFNIMVHGSRDVRIDGSATTPIANIVPRIEATITDSQ